MAGKQKSDQLSGLVMTIMAVPVAASALIGYLLGSWWVFVLLCIPLCTLTLALVMSQADGRVVAMNLAKAAETSLADGNRFSAASLFRQAAEILEGLGGLDEGERELVAEWRARAVRLERW